ncbi:MULTISPECIES: hypothetical protein [unclassified Variovorax]|uniref:hypothetical protein n=1 Tax=unclassified Variovorax TaxID=663243 RepID=UPI001BD41396|nr:MULTISPECIES: hypothetical protein [unclassified Variovorax]
MDLLEKWQLIGCMVTAIVVLAFLYWGWNQKAIKSEAARRIEAARIRSGHVPLEIPTTRSGLRSAGNTDDPDTLPEWFIQGSGEHAMVDETPRMQIRYLDVDGKKVQNVLQVEQLDLQKKLIVGHTDIPGDVRKIFLHQVLAARSAETGQRFNLDTWVEAVRVARRRRGLAH